MNQSRYSSDILIIIPEPSYLIRHLHHRPASLLTSHENSGSCTGYELKLVSSVLRPLRKVHAPSLKPPLQFCAFNNTDDVQTYSTSTRSNRDIPYRFSYLTRGWIKRRINRSIELAHLAGKYLTIYSYRTKRTEQILRASIFDLFARGLYKSRSTELSSKPNQCLQQN